VLTRNSRGDQSKQLIIEAGLPLGSIDALPPVDVSPVVMGQETALKLSVGH
jgi:ribose 5-phosphate isomerase A